MTDDRRRAREVEPTDPRVAIIEKMVSDRGWLLNSYAQIEYLLGDIVWQLRRQRGDPEPGADFPPSLWLRMRAVEAFCTEGGPLHTHAGNIVPLMEKLAQLEETRHFLVHGYCAFCSTPDGKVAMQFRRFVPPARRQRGSPTTRAEILVDPVGLTAARDAWTRFTSSAVHIFRDVYADLRLEEPDLLPGERRGEPLAD